MKRIAKHVHRKIKETPNLRLFNNLLTVVVVGLGTYIIAAPLWPQASWWIREESPLQAWTSQSEGVSEAADGTIGSDRLFIPSIGLEGVVLEGGIGQLKKGILRIGKSSTPDKGGNTVLAAHRFMYSEKGIFYHLDKVKVGDPITLHWFPERYDYEVTETFVVNPDETWIEAPTDDDILTLYTCTPLWTSKQRLVVRAKLVEGL